MKKIMVIIALLIFLGCQSIKPDQSTASSIAGGALSTMTQNEEGYFSATLSLPQKVKVNEEFTIKADLKKEIEQKLTISSRKKMFVYVIKDSSGKQINSYVISDGGKNRDVSGKVTISENYKYKIKQPGIYEITAVAEFTIIKDGKSEDFKIETDPKKVEIEKY